MKSTQDQRDKAQKLHEKALIVDFHCDAVLATLPDSAYSLHKGLERTLFEWSDKGHVDIPRFLEGGVDCQVFSHFVEPIYNPIAPGRMLQVLGFSLPLIERSPKLDLVTDPEQIYRNYGKTISVIIGFEGGEALGGDIRRLRVFHELGLRRLTLTWNNRNMIADGVKWQKAQGGLTKFGEEVIEECNKLGILVDVSHMTDRGFWDTVEVSDDPVIASHSNCRVLCDRKRNLTDRMIKALAEQDGVIGVNYATKYLVDQRKEGEPVTVQHVVDHIDHIVKVVGDTKHVGLGSDFEGVSSVAQGLDDVSKLPNLTKTLIARGYSDQDIKKILGENFLRVIKQVWK
ncbi:MAG: membrane dipeptidase [Candidatus Korarchaeota archaeon]|nr:membrane dipeptidase [Candidatus Korarchaeota archaeon]NIU83646.1 membrane dipeptidase [Candidatus Thorarchaeota archaeon]NIW13873.1 membrane dipeptidase [Candidatus Thorarchaeota archaeon]NIW51984.1 membrane dipeptidase [Candidatus Korarchaeota archaeon]